MKTLAFEDFDGNGVGGAMPSTLLEKARNDVNTTRNKRAYISGSSYLIQNTEITNAENLTLEVDVQSFVPINRASSNYNSPYGHMSDDWYFFNTDTQTQPQEALALKIDLTGAALYGRSGGANGSAITSGTYPALIHGDAARSANGDVKVYKRGDTFLPEHRLPSVSNLPEASNRDVMDPTHFMVVKNGASLSFFVNGEQKLEGTATNQSKTKGAIRLFYAGASLFSLDNIRVSTFELVEEAQIVADGVITNAADAADLATKASVQGTVSVKNFTTSPCDMKVIVVAYGNNNEMLGAHIVSGMSQVNGIDYVNSTFNMPVMPGVKKVKVFLWEDFTDRTQIKSGDFKIA